MSTRFPKAEADRDGELVWSPSGGNQADTIGGNSHLYSYRFQDREGRWRAESFLVDVGLLHRSPFYGDDHERIDTPDHTPYLPKAEAEGGLVRSQTDEPVIGAILITHGHSDHIAGLAAHIKAGGVTPPIYTAPYTANLIRAHLIENGIDKDHCPTINEVRPGDRIKLSERITVEVGGATHSLPHALSFLIETPTARHYHSGDIKHDAGSLVAGGTDLSVFRKWGERGIDSALLDSTGAEKEGWTKREETIRNEALELVSKHPSKRVTYTVLASYVEQLAGLAEVAAKTDRALVYAGRSIETHLAALEMSGIDLPGLIEGRTGKRPRILNMDSDEARRLKPAEALQIVTGVDGSSASPLAKAALGLKDSWKPSADDLIIWPQGFRAAQPKQVEKVERALRLRRVEVDRSNKRSDFGEGHGRIEELKAVLTALKPRTVIPTHGIPSMEKALGRLAESLGSTTTYGKNGDVFRLAKDGVAKLGERLTSWMSAEKTQYPDQPRYSPGSGFSPGPGPEAVSSRFPSPPPPGRRRAG